MRSLTRDGKGILVLLALCILFFTGYKLWAVHGLTVMAEVGDRLNRWEGKTLNRSFMTKIKAGNLSTDYTVEQAVKDVENLQLNTLNIPVAINIKDLTSSTMQVDPGSVQKARKLMKKLRSKKVNIILEPYPWIANGEFFETDWNPDDVEAFFYNWKYTVIKPLLEEVAIPQRVDAFCIASNLTHLEKYEDRWCDVADFAREKYRGLLTYKTNWWYTAVWDEATKEKYRAKLENKIFSKMDYIAIAAYFELSDQSAPTVEQLKKSLYSTGIHGREQNIVGEIEAFHQKWGIPVFFGELGFPRRERAAAHPWHPSPSDKISDIEQAACFQAYREVFTQDWFLGFSVFAIGNRSEDKNYYPSEESARIIREWFHDGA